MRVRSCQPRRHEEEEDGGHPRSYGLLNGDPGPWPADEPDDGREDPEGQRDGSDAWRPQRPRCVAVGQHCHNDHEEEYLRDSSVDVSRVLREDPDQGEVET